MSDIEFTNLEIGDVAANGLAPGSQSINTLPELRTDAIITRGVQEAELGRVVDIITDTSGAIIRGSRVYFKKEMKEGTIRDVPSDGVFVGDSYEEESDFIQADEYKYLSTDINWHDFQRNSYSAGFFYSQYTPMLGRSVGTYWERTALLYRINTVLPTMRGNHAGRAKTYQFGTPENPLPMTDEMAAKGLPHKLMLRARAAIMERNRLKDGMTSVDMPPAVGQWFFSDPQVSRATYSDPTRPSVLNGNGNDNMFGMGLGGLLAGFNYKETNFLPWDAKNQVFPILVGKPKATKKYPRILLSYIERIPGTQKARCTTTFIGATKKFILDADVIIWVSPKATAMPAA